MVPLAGTSRTFHVALAAAIALSAFPLITVEAQAAGESGFVTLYLTDDALSPATPVDAVSKKKSIVTTIHTPAISVGTFPQWGNFEMPHDLKFTSNAQVIFWLVADSPVLITQARANFFKGTTNLNANAGTGNAGEGIGAGAGVVLDTVPRKFVVASPLNGAEWAAGDKFGISFSYFGLATNSAPQTSVYMLYGSTTHPSGLSVAVDNLGSLPSSGSARSVYLGPDKTLAFAAPASEADLLRATENAGPGSLGSSAVWSWGKITTTEDMTLTRGSTAAAWASLQGNAAVLRGVRMTVVFKPVDGAAVTKTTSIGVTPLVFDSGGATASANCQICRFVMGLDTEGIVLPSGSEIEVQVATFSSSDPTLGQVMIRYGSIGRPSGLTLATLGGGSTGGASPAPVALNFTADPMEASAAPGEVASFALGLANEGDGALTVELNATGDASFSFLEGSQIVLEAGASATVTLEATVPSDAASDSTIPILVDAMVDGVSVANLTLTLNVVAPAETPSEEEETPSEEEEESEEESEGTATEDNETSDGEGGSPLPGFELLGVALAILGAVAFRSRRRSG